MSAKYTTMLANAGERSVLLVGWQVMAVFMEPNHAQLAARVAELLNRHAPSGSGADCADDLEMMEAERGEGDA